jgi:sulfate adenylyltransferase subunit 2
VSERSVLDELEAESVHILRDAVAQAKRPVLLYSVGKDSSVLLHLARKAFHPAPVPFPVLHIDTTWNPHEMITFRDALVARYGLDLIAWINHEGLDAGYSPITHPSDVYTDVMLTQALRAALDHHRFDLALGGARRDEERSRAKERVFSVRGPGHVWDPRRQRPELWRLNNARLAEGETVRVFPLSNWTELDVWRYIEREGIPLVPLYLAEERRVIERDGTLIMVDDDRLVLREGEVVEHRRVRFRTLGCYPLSGCVESTATTVDAIVREIEASSLSERQGRLIDGEGNASMEAKKREGYF